MASQSSQQTVHLVRGRDDGAVGNLEDLVPLAPPRPGENSSAPLPALPMTTMLGEFLSSNVSVPFLLFMVKDFGFIDEAKAAFWTGILVAMFFLSQFLTSLLWATLSERYGRRIVLVITLFGSAVSVTAFGLTKSITQAILLRLAQGVFAGAVGVARGSVVFITDSSNEGRAYAVLGYDVSPFSYMILAVNMNFIFPDFAGDSVVFLDPSLEERSSALRRGGRDFITGIFSRISRIFCPVPQLDQYSFLDGSSRGDMICGHPEKAERSLDLVEEVLPKSRGCHSQSRNGSIRRHRSRWDSSPNPSHAPGIPIGGPTFSRPRSASRHQRGSLGRTVGSLYQQMLVNSSSPSYGTIGGELALAAFECASHVDEATNANDLSDNRSIAERMVLANENAVSSIADLWVAAALNIDEVFGEDGATERPINDTQDLEECLVDNCRRGRSNSRWIPRNPTPIASRMSNRTSSRHRSSSRLSAINYNRSTFDNSSVKSQVVDESRRFPSILARSGVDSPAAVHESQANRGEIDLGSLPERELPPILETRLSSCPSQEEQLERSPLLHPDMSPAPQPARQIPLIVIGQFGLLALHTTTHDQVFMSYLISEYDAGGLGLSASDFAQLIALMGIAQIFYQFYLYPPPKGRLSHLTMYRLGTFLFIPAYLTVVMYRNLFAQPGGSNKIALMTALVLSTAVRYCGMTFAFTSISVLLNCATPPEAVGYANGLAQTIVSLARCAGPVLGGWIWSASVEGHPSGYPLGFVVCASTCVLAMMSTAFIE
ncbi:hypothetical protein D9757_010815 [Collybiopsis confluens]|uniref:Major facilitator superfamily (MFS) profile domain-containing protein n=1 Tax=Collybiopsis confluens TaxID=2823264 RepID=A0A8H5LVI1_9AGAR|nr:hypothetical protein D9757_010815 [Collybiopsis confluens]